MDQLITWRQETGSNVSGAAQPNIGERKSISLRTLRRILRNRSWRVQQSQDKHQHLLQRERNQLVHRIQVWRAEAAKTPCSNPSSRCRAIQSRTWDTQTGPPNPAKTHRSR